MTKTHQIDGTSTIGDLVVENYHNIEVFKGFNIDFCCGGSKTLKEACSEKGLDFEDIANALTKVQATGIKDEYDFENRSLNELLDHILDRHHAYVKKVIPVLSESAIKLRATHGESKPYLVEIVNHVLGLFAELQAHLLKEENILFPFIREMENAKLIGEKITPPFGTIQNPIAAMYHEHDHAGDELKEIRSLSMEFTPSADACNTHLAFYEMLKDFESDLMMHIHLENNILFPKAVEVENKMNLIKKA